MARRSNGRRSRSMAQEIGKLREDMTQLTQQLGSVADTAADGALDQVRTQVQRVKGGIDELFAEASDRGQELFAEASERGQDAAVACAGWR